MFRGHDADDKDGGDGVSARCPSTVVVVIIAVVVVVVFVVVGRRPCSGLVNPRLFRLHLALTTTTTIFFFNYV